MDDPGEGWWRIFNVTVVGRRTTRKNVLVHLFLRRQSKKSGFCLCYLWRLTGPSPVKEKPSLTSLNFLKMM